jgi:hypothetical protein
LSRSVLVLSIAAAVAGCGDDSDNSPGAGGSSGSAGRAGASGAAGAAGAAGSSGAAGAAGAAGSGGTGGSGNDAGTTFDHAATCSAYCGAAAAFQRGASAADAGAGDAGVGADAGDTDGGTVGSGPACQTDIPDCQATCLGNIEAFDNTACTDEVRVMWQCFVSEDTWVCADSPSYPNPAGCVEQQTDFGICASQL